MFYFSDLHSSLPCHFHLTVRQFVSPLVRTSVRPSIGRSSVNPSICLSVHNPSVRLSICPSIAFFHDSRNRLFPTCMMDTQWSGDTCMHPCTLTYTHTHTHKYTQTRGPQWVETAWNRRIQFMDEKLFPISSGASEWASEHTNKRSVTRERMRANESV